MVTLRREVKRGTRGPDAFAVKRALKRKGFGAGLAVGGGKASYTFGPVAVYQLKRFQRKYGLRADGVYGKSTHTKMSYSGGFDAYGKYLMAKAPAATSPIAEKRKAIVATALFGARNKYSIHYTQSWLRMYGVRNKIKPPGIPRYEDCSSFSTWCYWVAGAADPNGLGYSGFGFTGTLASHGRRVSTPKPGDLVFYGPYPHSHVTIYIGNGMCVSHGSEIGPIVTRYNYRPVAQIRSYFAD
jgi:putative peptidoglycan binding protein/NlpC/P60 family protein